MLTVVIFIVYTHNHILLWVSIPFEHFCAVDSAQHVTTSGHFTVSKFFIEGEAILSMVSL